MTKMYYKNASAAVICFSMIEKASFEKAKTWVNELNQNADDVFVCLVATKCMCACAPSDQVLACTLRLGFSCVALSSVFVQLIWSMKPNSKAKPST